MRVTFTFGAVAQRAFALMLFLLGLVVAIYGWNYGLGQLNDIGSGAFPLGLGVVLMVLAIVAFFTVANEAPVTRHNLKPFVLILAGIAIWAMLIEGAGLLIANAALVAVMYFSEDEMNALTAVILTVCLTLGGYLVLVLGFNLPIQMLGDWL